jgi:hypothetical protein
MAARPLPGATYHTVDLAFHTYPDVDLEAVDPYGPSEKTRVQFPVQTPHAMTRLRRGPPVMLILLSLCCLSFVASALVGHASRGPFVVPLDCVPERHAPLAARISAASQTEPNKEWTYRTQEKALDILCVRTHNNGLSFIGSLYSIGRKSSILRVLVATPLMCAITCGKLTPFC